MIGALAISGEPLVVAQAAAAAILTVAARSGEAGPQRLVDALIGVGAALVMSQLVFPAEPVALLRRAEVATLATLAEGLGLTARARTVGRGARRTGGRPSARHAGPARRA